jgi:pilus assembly protein FimV
VLLPTAPAVQVEPVIPSSIKPEPAPAEQPDSIIEDLGSVEEPAVQEAAPVPEAVPVQEAAPVQEPAPVGKSDAITTYGPVKSGDTLSKIAMEVAPPNVQLNQMLIAMHRANREAFSDNNMNRLKTGPTLRIPDKIEIATISPDEADKEVKMQTANWEAYRQKLAEDSASIPSVSEEPTQTATGKITTIIDSSKSAAEKQPKESLKISKGAEPGGSSSEDAIGAQEKIRSMQESAIASKKSLNEANTRISMLEKSVKDLQHLLELKSSSAPIAPLEESPEVGQDSSVEGDGAAAETPTIEDEPSPEVVPPPSVEKSESPVKSVPVPPVVVEEPPLMDSIGPIIDSLMENIEYVGAALLLLLTGIFGAAAIRRRKQAAIDDDSSIEDTAPTNTDLKLPNETGSGGATEGMADDDDPVAEAGQYLDHGRDVQAEKILKDALAKNKGNPELLAKLLDVYTLRKDKSAFETTARTLWAVSPTGPLWDKAAKLGLSIDPENPFYGGSVVPPSDDQIKGAASNEDAPSSPQQVDTSEESSNVISSGVEPLEYKPETSEPLDEPIKFESSSEEDGVNPETPDTINSPTSDDTSIDFPSVPETESVPIPESSPIPPPETGLEGINLNVGDDDTLSTTSVDTKSAEKSAQWHEIATKLDLARAYQEMGDNDGAKEILQEVVQEGDAEQQESARVILGNL